MPVLELDDGRRLREGPAIVQYIADQALDRPPAGTRPAVIAAMKAEGLLK